MKSITMVFSFCLMLGLNSCNQGFKKLDESKTDDKKIQIAKNFAINFYAKLKNGSYYEFKDEATDKIKNFLSEEKQKSGYKSIKEQCSKLPSVMREL